MKIKLNKKYIQSVRRKKDKPINQMKDMKACQGDWRDIVCFCWEDRYYKGVDFLQMYL